MEIRIQDSGDCRVVKVNLGKGITATFGEPESKLNSGDFKLLSVNSIRSGLRRRLKAGLQTEICGCTTSQKQAIARYPNTISLNGRAIIASASSAGQAHQTRSE